MNGEYAFLLITFLSLVFVFVGGLLGREWLYACVVALALTASVTAGKIIAVLGVSSSAATPIYAGIFLATDALSELHGKREARRAVWMGLYANIALVVGGRLVVSTSPVGDPAISEALDTLFAFIPRLVAGGLIAFIVAQHLDIWIFHWIRDRIPGTKWLWVRNNGSTVVAQLVDTVLVYTIAFAGLFPLTELILVAWVMKVLVAMLDTPFLYALKAIRKAQTTG